MTGSLFGDPLLPKEDPDNHDEKKEKLVDIFTIPLFYTRYLRSS